MEIPYGGRATVNKYDTYTEIIVPAKRIYFFMIFFGIYISGWILGGIAVIFSAAFSSNPDFPVVMFILIWLLITSFITFFIGRGVWWMAFGKEIIIIERDVLTVEKKGALFVKPKSYDLNEAKNFRVQEDFVSYQNIFGFNKAMLLNMWNTGTIRFDYGMQTVKIAGGIDEAEATFLLQNFSLK